MSIPLRETRAIPVRVEAIGWIAGRLWGMGCQFISKVRQGTLEAGALPMLKICFHNFYFKFLLQKSMSVVTIDDGGNCNIVDMESIGAAPKE